MKYLVSYSGGLGSFMAAWLIRHEWLDSGDTMELVFTDTRTEDRDLYRFLNESARAIGEPLVHLSDGRDIWGVMRSHRFHSNNRVDHCSADLKRKIFRNYILADVNVPDEEITIVLGIGADEQHRMVEIAKNWEPIKTIAPLIEQPFTKEQILDLLSELGIEPPRLYEMGFPRGLTNDER